MKRVIVILSFLLASSSFAETWYGYCIAEKNDTRYCTNPEPKTDDMKAKCIAFAKELGSRAYEIQYGTDLPSLEAAMIDHCDEIKGSENNDVYACQYATLCPHGTARISHLASRVYANTKSLAIERCALKNQSKIQQKLKMESAKDCYLRLVVEKYKETK